MSDAAPTTTRCTDCGAEFTDEQVRGANACPACGATGVPCDPRQDVTVRINWHELRILTIWADNWAAEKCPPHSRRTLAAILRRLDAQRPADAAALTLVGEIREMQDAGIDVELVAGDGTVKVSRRGQS